MFIVSSSILRLYYYVCYMDDFGLCISLIFITLWLLACCKSGKLKTKGQLCERNALKARLSALPADDCNYLNKFTQLFASCGWLDQRSTLSAAYLIHPQMKGLLLSSVPTASLRRSVVTDSINSPKWWYWFQWRMQIVHVFRMIGLAAGWAVWIMCDSVVLKSLLCSVSRRRSLHAWLQPDRLFNMCLPGGENGLEVR